MIHQSLRISVTILLVGLLPDMYDIILSSKQIEWMNEDNMGEDIITVIPLMEATMFNVTLYLPTSLPK